jgi:hypothetical protein
LQPKIVPLAFLAFLGVRERSAPGESLLPRRLAAFHVLIRADRLPFLKPIQISLAIGKVKNCGSHHIVSVQIETSSH